MRHESGEPRDLRQRLPLSQGLTSCGHCLLAGLGAVIHKQAVHLHFPFTPCKHHLQHKQCERSLRLLVQSEQSSDESHCSKN